MKILQIASGDIWGGSIAQVVLQTAALRDLDVDVHIALLNDGIGAERCAERKIPHTVISESMGFFAGPKKLKTFYKEFTPDIVISHGYKEAALAFTLSAPLVTTFHGFTEQYRGWKRVKAALYFRIEHGLAQSSARGIIAVSEDLLRTLAFDSLPKARVIRNVVDSTHFESSRSGHPEGFVFIGRLAQVKRCDRAIRIWSQLVRKTGISEKLTILGDGPLRKECEKLASQLGMQNHIHFVGFTDNVARYLQQTRGLLITSESEGIPTALLEAMALGIPIVSTAVGGIPEVANLFPKYPLHLLPIEDEGGFIRALIEVIESGESVAADVLGEIQSWSAAKRAAEELRMYCAELS